MPPKPIKSFKHKAAKRAHIPSAEEAGYEAASPKAQVPERKLPLNPIVTRGQDPELFWMHKYGSDEKLTAQLDELQSKLKSGDTAGARTALENLRDLITHRYEQPDDETLSVDIRSLYRHEHIGPETLIKSLYRMVVHSSHPSQEDLFSPAELFGNAIAHEELDKVSDYYTHSDGWTNRLIQGDSLSRSKTKSGCAWPGRSRWKPSRVTSPFPRRNWRASARRTRNSAILRT